MARKRLATQGVVLSSDTDPRLIAMINHIDYLVGTGSVTLLWPNWDSVIWITLGTIMAIISLAITVFFSSYPA